jgi:hypothetical protein
MPFAYITASFLLVASLTTALTALPPYPYANATSTNGNTSDSNPSTTTPGHATVVSNNSCTATPSIPAGIQPPCQTAYAAEIRHMNSLYPHYKYPPTKYFLALRHYNPSELQMSSQIQFTGLPAKSNVSEGHACTLELAIPAPGLTKIQGTSPIAHVYQVARKAGASASWETFEGGDGEPVFSTINIQPEVLEGSRTMEGKVVLGPTECNETLTFQVALVPPETQAEVNYWDFINVKAPATPVQGWRIVYGC